MRIIVTGAGGFVGRHVLPRLIQHEVVALDVNLEHIPDGSNIIKVEGDLREPDTLARAFIQGCDAVIHLATVPGGAAESDPVLAKSVNIDATMALIDMAEKAGNCPRFVFASSIAVFGKLPLTPVVDKAPTRPTMLYGTQKLMMENWIATQTRRGEIEGISLRLPGIVARPKSPSGMKSAFLSDLFHALRAGEDFTMPVSPNATTWLCSVEAAAENIANAATSHTNLSQNASPVMIPTLRVKVKDLEDEIRRQIGPSSSCITYDCDAAIQSIFGEHPDIKTPTADRFGFIGDKTLKDLVKTAL